MSWPVFDDVFWISFWPGILSSLATTIILTGFFGTIFYWLRQPKLQVIIQFLHSTRGRKSLEIKIRNTGKTSLMSQEAQWYFYFPQEFKSNNDGLVMTGLNGRSFYEATGFNDVPCHPGSTISLRVIDFEIDSNASIPSLDKSEFYCAISTNKGLWKPSRGIFSKCVKGYPIFVDEDEVRKVFPVSKIFF